jgi:hypothetical protein
MAAQPLNKNAGDVLSYEMSFGMQPEIRAGLYITSCAVTQAVLNGGTGSITVGAIAVAGPIVQVVLSGGLAGNSYLITFTATLSNGQVRVLNGILNVLVQ